MNRREFIKLFAISFSTFPFAEFKYNNVNTQELETGMVFPFTFCKEKGKTTNVIITRFDVKNKSLFERLFYWLN